MIEQCVICSPTFAPGAATTFCVYHRRIREYYARNRLMLDAVRKACFRERSDFPRDGFSHLWHQLAGPCSRTHWVVELDDILRTYGVHYERDERGDESEAA